MKNVFVILGILIISSSCVQYRRITWNPDFHGHDHTTQEIFNDRGFTTSCSDPEFDQYLSLHRTKVEELREIIRAARIPKNVKVIMLQKLEVDKKLINRYLE